MTASTIKNLPAKVMASKSDWGIADKCITFTPINDSLAARSRCESNVCRQFGDGYVLEYITETVDESNPGFETHEERQKRLTEHDRYAGRLIKVHRLRHTACPLVDIIGEERYKRTQDMWAKEGKRWRWAVAFPIVESHIIIDQPKARDVFGNKLYRRLYGHQARELRPLTNDERTVISDLKIQEVEAPHQVRNTA
jgi:5-methylcytosine-specific restriction protein A